LLERSLDLQLSAGRRAGDQGTVQEGGRGDRCRSHRPAPRQAPAAVPVVRRPNPIAAGLAVALACGAAWAQSPPPDAVTRASPSPPSTKTKTTPIVAGPLDGGAPPGPHPRRPAAARPPGTNLTGTSPPARARRTRRPGAPRPPP